MLILLPIKFILDWKLEPFFEGDCQDHNGEFDRFSFVLYGSLDECRKQCIDRSSCSAFSHDFSSRICYHYRGGPYTLGSGDDPLWRENQRCYVLKKGKY